MPIADCRETSFTSKQRRQYEMIHDWYAETLLNNKVKQGEVGYLMCQQAITGYRGGRMLPVSEPEPCPTTILRMHQGCEAAIPLAITSQ